MKNKKYPEKKTKKNIAIWRSCIVFPKQKIPALPSNALKVYREIHFSCTEIINIHLEIILWSYKFHHSITSAYTFKGWAQREANRIKEKFRMQIEGRGDFKYYLNNKITEKKDLENVFPFLYLECHFIRVNFVSFFRFRLENVFVSILEANNFRRNFRDWLYVFVLMAESYARRKFNRQ